MEKKFIWTSEYSVHVAELDEQHQEFINICNGLLELTENGSFTNEEALIKVMKLGDYASYHLATEEEFFIKTNYPDSASHIVAHDLFREKAKEFINEIRDKNYDIKISIKNMAEFTANWLLEHIKHVDQKYSNYFNQHEIK